MKRYEQMDVYCAALASTYFKHFNLKKLQIQVDGCYFLINNRINRRDLTQQRHQK